MTIDEINKLFERWFIANYLSMFEHSNPLKKGKNGIYKDRGTLGMWIVWRTLYPHTYLDKREDFNV